MGEWKRIFLNKSRLILLAALTVFCLATFLTSLTNGLSFNSFKHMFAAADCARKLCESWAGKSPDELEAAVEAEKSQLTAYGNYVNGFTFGAAQTSVPTAPAEGDYSYLLSLADNVNDFNGAYGAFITRINDLADEIAHLRSYPAYLAGISEQAKTQSRVSMFGKTGSFAAKNLEQTAGDFEALDGIELEFGNNFGIEKWLDFGLADYFFLGILTVIVLAFLDERKAGLWSVVRGCKNGRLRLGLHRLGILLASSAAATVLVYLIPLTVSLLINGGAEALNRPLQSLISFKTCTLRITVLQWLCRFLTLKIISGFAVGLLLWCLLGTLSNPQFSLSVLAALLVAEYLLFEFMPVQSFLNIFKFFNIFSYIRTSELYTKYLNINFFGISVGIRSLMLTALPVMILSLTAWALLIQSRRYPEGNKDYLTKLLDLKNRLFDVFRTRLTIGGWELYKSLVYEFGAVIIVAIIVLTGSLTYNAGIFEPDSYYRMYLSDLEGKIDENSDLYFDRAMNNIPQGSDEAAIKSSLERLKNVVSQAKIAAREGGFEAWLVNQNAYDSFYGFASLDRQRANATAAIALLILCCAGASAYENQTGTVKLLRSQKRGRGAILMRKTAVCFMMSTVVWAAVYLREFVSFINFYGAKTLPAPVQNLPALAEFPLKITLGQYLAALYALRLAMLAACSGAVLALGMTAKTVLQSLVVNIAVFCISAMLTLFGADVMKYFSPLIPVSSAEILWQIGSGDPTSGIAWAIWLVISAAALAAAVRRWCIA